MFACLKLEAIGWCTNSTATGLAAVLATKFNRRIRKPWCAKVIGFFASGKPRYEFLRGHVDWSQSNGAGSRGVRLVFYPESGFAYHARYYSSWRRQEDDWFRVSRDGSICNMAESDALEWAREHMDGVVPMSYSEGVWTSSEG